MMSFLCIAMIAAAQDIIVKKDGTVIKAKVTKVSSNEIEYKKFENIDGPTYAVNVSELLSVTYQNGETEKFSAAEQPQSLVINTDVYQGPQVSDVQLLAMSRANEKMYNKGKRLVVIGSVVGGSMILGCATLVIAGEIDGSDKGIAGFVVGVTGGAIGIPLVCVGLNKMKKAKRIDVMSLYEYNIPLGSNTMMTANVNLMKDNMTRQYAPGLGVNINF